MIAGKLNDLLKKGDRVAVSNITGREASVVSSISQKYCNSIVGGWALGKGGQTIETAKEPIPVFATFEELLRMTPAEKHPNKIRYKPPKQFYVFSKNSSHLDLMLPPLFQEKEYFQEPLHNYIHDSPT